NRKIMLEGPLVLLSCGAILLYLWTRPALQQNAPNHLPRRPLLILGLAGAVAALSALTKIAGLACLLAILADMIWLRFESRRTSGPWRIGILWTLFSLLLFTYSRSFYQHYYIQLAAPLCILGAGVSLRWWTKDERRRTKDERSYSSPSRSQECQHPEGTRPR